MAQHARCGNAPSPTIVPQDAARYLQPKRSGEQREGTWFESTQRERTGGRRLRPMSRADGQRSPSSERAWRPTSANGAKCALIRGAESSTANASAAWYDTTTECRPRCVKAGSCLDVGCGITKLRDGSLQPEHSPSSFVRLARRPLAN